MATIVRMPSVLAGAETGTIANWLVADGDTVTTGDTIAEIETEKAVVDYAAEAPGVVGRIVAPTGATVAIGEPILVLLAEGEDPAAADALLAADVPAVLATIPGPTPAREIASAPVPDPAAVVLAPARAAAPAPDPGARTFASPLARRLAQDHGLALAALTGTGPGGRVTRRDVTAALTARPNAPAREPSAPSASTAPAAPGSAAPTLLPHTPMRRAIARRLTESKATVPHFYLVAECLVDDLLELRARVNALHGRKVSLNDFVVKAAAAAFTEVPEANVTWTEEGLLQHGPVDISVAVATDGGLVTPVVRDAGSRSLASISAGIADLAARAREKKLRQDELEGGSFSVSNLGMYTTVEFAAIINPPQWGILAVGAVKRQPVADGETVRTASVMRCTLSVDHRAVDGALAARWLSAFQERVEQPLGILV